MGRQTKSLPFEQALASSSESLALHVTMIQQHLHLNVHAYRHFSECQAKLHILAADTQSQQMRTANAKLRL